VAQALLYIICSLITALQTGQPHYLRHLLQASHLDQPSPVLLLLFHVHQHPSLKYLTGPSTTRHLLSGIPYLLASVNLPPLI